MLFVIDFLVLFRLILVVAVAGLVVAVVVHYVKSVCRVKKVRPQRNGAFDRPTVQLFIEIGRFAQPRRAAYSNTQTHSNTTQHNTHCAAVEGTGRARSVAAL